MIRRLFDVRYVARSESNGLSVGVDAERCSPHCREAGLALESTEERGGAAAGNPGSVWLHSLIQDLRGATGVTSGGAHAAIAAARAQNDSGQLCCRWPACSRSGPGCCAAPPPDTSQA